MGRARKTRKQGVSLFPFLDILACVIGNLMLIIATVVLEQVDTQPMAEAARIAGLEEEASQAVAKAAELQKQLDDMRKRSGAATAKLDDIREKIAAAKERAADAVARASTASKPSSPSPQMTDELKQLDKTRQKLEAEVADLKSQIAERSTVPKDVIAVLPSGEPRRGRKGIFIEATKAGLIIHDRGRVVKVPAATIGSDPKFKAVLDAAAADSTIIVTFLVRSDGIGVLSAARGFAAAAGVKTGRVPLPGEGPLDLSGVQ